MLNVTKCQLPAPKRFSTVVKNSLFFFGGGGGEGSCQIGLRAKILCMVFAISKSVTAPG